MKCLPKFIVNGGFGKKYYVDGKNVRYPDSLNCTNGNVDYHNLWIGSRLAGGSPESDCELFLLGFLFKDIFYDLESKYSNSCKW